MSETSPQVKWNADKQLPYDNYVVRVIEEDFAPSQKGSPMVTWKFEIASPNSVIIGNEDVIIAGVRLSLMRRVLKSVNDDGSENEGKTKTVREMFNKFITDCGLPAETNFENPALGLKGKLLHVAIKAPEVAKRKTPTAEQLAKGEKQGDILLNPITGKPNVQYWPEIDIVYGAAPSQSGEAFA